MTANELAQYLRDTYGMDRWPTEFEVDAETYGNVCQACFDSLYRRTPDDYMHSSIKVIEVVLGPSRGILFHSVELRLKV